MFRKGQVTLLLVAVILVLGLVGVAQAQTASKTFYWNRLDVDITVLPNSDMRIVETWQATFTSGTFTFAYRDIPMERVTDITDLAVSEGTQKFGYGALAGDYQFLASPSEGKMNLKFFFPPTSDSTHTYTLSYTVKGGLRFYPGGDQVWWKAVFADRVFPVNASTVTVNLPEGATADVVASYGAPAKYDIVSRQKVVFTAQGPIPGGHELEVRVQFPHGIVKGTAAPWQAIEDVKPNVARLPAPCPLLPVLLTFFFLGKQQPGQRIAQPAPVMDFVPAAVHRQQDE